MQVLRTYNVDEFDSVKNITQSSLCNDFSHFR